MNTNDTAGEILAIPMLALEDLVLEHELIYRRRFFYPDECVIASATILSSVLCDKMQDLIHHDKMQREDAELMAKNLGTDIKKLIFKYTNIDTKALSTHLNQKKNKK